MEIEACTSYFDFGNNKLSTCSHMYPNAYPFEPLAKSTSAPGDHGQCMSENKDILNYKAKGNGKFTLSCPSPNPSPNPPPHDRIESVVNADGTAYVTMNGKTTSFTNCKPSFFGCGGIGPLSSLSITSTESNGQPYTTSLCCPNDSTGHGDFTFQTSPTGIDASFTLTQQNGTAIKEQVVHTNCQQAQQGECMPGQQLVEYVNAHDAGMDMQGWCCDYHAN